MRLEQRVSWTACDVRAYCIKNDFYTRGDNQSYGAMLEFVDENDPTDRSVRLVAMDIITHSAKSYSFFDEGDVECIASDIWNNVVKVRFVYVDDEE